MYVLRSDLYRSPNDRPVLPAAYLCYRRLFCPHSTPGFSDGNGGETPNKVKSKTSEREDKSFHGINNLHRHRRRDVEILELVSRYMVNPLEVLNPLTLVKRFNKGYFIQQEKWKLCNDYGLIVSTDEVFFLGTCRSCLENGIDPVQCFLFFFSNLEVSWTGIAWYRKIVLYTD